MQETYYLAQKFPPNFIAFQSNISPCIDFETNTIPYDHDHQPRISNNLSTSDDADEGYMSIINERKHRRMISNRESAKRARVRKQRQLDKLCTQVKRLMNENHVLMVQLNQFSESHEQVIQENDKLKKESLELKMLLSEAQLHNIFTTLGDLTSGPTDHLRVQSSHKSNVILF